MGPQILAGTGRVVVDFAGTSSSFYANPVTVTNTATLAIKPGKTMTTGVITVADGATLAVPQSGEVALGGNLTLKNNATLAFNFTERTIAPVLAVSSVTADGAIKVAVSGKWPKVTGAVKTVTLTSGGKFTGKTVELVTEGKPTWAKSVAIENGEIVLEVKPMAIMVLVK